MGHPNFIVCRFMDDSFDLKLVNRKSPSGIHEENEVPFQSLDA